MTETKKISLAQLEEELANLQELPNNLYMQGNSLLLEKGMQIEKEELAILKKWKIHNFELRAHMKTSIESFNTLYQYDLETLTRLYNSMQKLISDFYESIEKSYKVPMPDFLENFKTLYAMSTIKLLVYVFYLHLQPSNSLVKTVIRSSVYAVMVAKRMGLAEEQVEKIYYGNIFSEIGFLKRSETNMANALRGEKPKSMDFNYMKEHVGLGYELFQELLNYSKEYAFTILLHHEYEDGSGFNKIERSKLSLPIQILTVCQEYSYITSNFLKDTMATVSLTNGMIMLLRHEHRYNKDVLNAFISIFSFYPPGEFLVLDDGSIAVSVATRSNTPQIPTIEKIADEKGNPNKEVETIALNASNHKIYAVLNNKAIIRRIVRHFYN